MEDFEFERVVGDVKDLFSHGVRGKRGETVIIMLVPRRRDLRFFSRGPYMTYVVTEIGRAHV